MSIIIKWLLECKSRSKRVKKKCVQHWNQNKIKDKYSKGLIGGKTSERILALLWCSVQPFLFFLGNHVELPKGYQYPVRARYGYATILGVPMLHGSC